MLFPAAIPTSLLDESCDGDVEDEPLSELVDDPGTTRGTKLSVLCSSSQEVGWIEKRWGPDPSKKQYIGNLDRCRARSMQGRRWSKRGNMEIQSNTPALGVNNNDVFVWELPGLGLEQQFRTTERQNLDEKLKHHCQSKSALSRACSSLDRQVAGQRAIFSTTFACDRAFMIVPSTKRRRARSRNPNSNPN